MGISKSETPIDVSISLYEMCTLLLNFFFFIMIPNGYVAGTQPNIMTENNNKEKRTYQSLCHVTPSVAGITRIGPTSALLTQTGPYSDNAPGPQPFTLHISYSGPPRITGKKWGR